MTIYEPIAQMFSGDHADRLVTFLNSDDEDDWNYEVELVDPENDSEPVWKRIIVKDETGEKVGYL